MSILSKAGLTENESRVYTALLRAGSTTAGPLIKELGMHRAAVYDTLDKLIEKGLVSFVIKANRKYFEAQDPDRLVEFMESRMHSMREQTEELKRELPRLKSMRAISKESQEGYVYKGKKGIISVCEDILREKKDCLVFGSRGNFIQLLQNYFPRFHKKRAELDIRMKIIRNASTRGAKWSKGLRLREERYLSDDYTTPSTTWIYGDKVAIIVWSPDPMAFLVRSKTVADSYRKYFEVLWKVAKA